MKNIEVKKGEVKQPTAEDFAKAYNKLIDETGFRLVCVPAWIARDDGSFSMVLNYTVGKIPKQEN